MSNLFNIFDPKIGVMNLSFNWMAIFFFIFIPNIYWLNNHQIIQVIKSLLMYLYKEIYAILGKFYSPGSTLFSISLFMFIMMNNIMGLLPYIFTSSSHMSFSLSLALPLWIGHMVYAWVNQPMFMFAHLVPLGTPVVLMPFMVCIELISNLIRPLTLSVRLAANLIAGHLLLTIISSNSSSYLVVLCVILCLFVMSMLELGVAIIQAYVFSVLMSLYLNDVSSLKIV